MPAFATYTYRHAFLDLMEGSIPVYFHRLTEQELVDARGEPVLVDWPIYDRPRPAPYFPTATFQVLQAQLERLLTEDVEALLQQYWS